MKFEHKGFIVKVDFVGDAITPVYSFKLYKPRKYWFAKCVWEERPHRSQIANKQTYADKAIKNYEANIQRWL